MLKKNTMEEIWKDIKGYEGIFQVSNLGRVKSLGLSGKGIGKGKWRKELILKPDNTCKQNGYIKPRVSLQKKHYQVSVLVAKAFPEICGEWFDGCVVHHIDQDSTNNNALNLKVLSKEEHNKLHTELGQHKGVNNYWYGKKIPKEIINKMIKAKRKPIWQIKDNEYFAYWFSVTDCERATGFKKASINKCCLGKQHTAYGCKWEYVKKR